MIVAYVSGHGYGHATRVGEVLRVLREREPRLPLTIVSSAPVAAFGGPAPLTSYRSLQCDVGLVQQGALVIDEQATLARCRQFALTWEALVETEASWLRGSGARLVLGDVPPLAFAASAAAGIPGLALANFSWDWIYRYLSVRQPGLGAAADAARSAYSSASLLMRLPFAGDLSAFPRIADIPLVARRPRTEKVDARRRLGLDGVVVLLSFGGLGLPLFACQVLAGLDEYTFVVPEVEGAAPRNVTEVSGARLHAAGLGYPDLVGAADVVVTKPGYGIVSDAIGAGTRLVYTERGDFPEYPIVVREMARYLPSVHVSNQDLMQGRLREPLRSVMNLPFPAPPDVGGAAVAARHVLDHAAI